MKPTQGRGWTPEVSNWKEEVVLTILHILLAHAFIFKLGETAEMEMPLNNHNEIYHSGIQKVSQCQRDYLELNLQNSFN